MICRADENPVIQKEDIPASRSDFEVIGVFNAGVAAFNGETILLIRVAEKAVQNGEDYICPVYSEKDGKITTKKFKKNQIENDKDPRTFWAGGKQYLTSISHFHVARSKDGVHFKPDAEPFMMPATKYEAFGIEDARVSQIDGHYYITYTAASSMGCVVGLAVTDDFVSVRREGVLFPPDNKDSVYFDRKIGGRYYALHRPSASEFAKPEIWLAESGDGKCFGMHRFVAGVRSGSWDSARIGAGAPPFLTEKGWIEIYHGATEDNRYCMGAMLLDKNKPWEVLARSKKPLLEPEYPYEQNGFFSNVIFGCGATKNGDTVRLYYGAADSSIAVASMTVQDIYRNLGLLKI